MTNPIRFYRIVLKILASVAAIFYVVFLVDEKVAVATIISLEGIAVYLLFIFFLIGYLYIWKNEIVAGVLWVMWYALQWGLVFTVWSNGTLTLVLGFPIPLLGAFLLWHGFRQRAHNKQLNAQNGL